MGRLVEQVQTLARGYTRKGGKDNRRQQAARMAAFAAFCEVNAGVEELGQVGKRHVVRYWIEHRHLSHTTLYNHHRALVILWRLAGKSGLPPEAVAPSSKKVARQPLTIAEPDGDVDAPLAVSREAPRDLSV